MEDGILNEERLPRIGHLIVDEFQDLNACDQRFVQLLAERGAALFVAGDDDQGIYLFRHANPQGIVSFPDDYPGSSSHILTHCFRCPPATLDAASALIRHNPGRVEKDLQSLLGNAQPPVGGLFRVWSFADEEAEASSLAGSCQALLDAGMRGRESSICILVQSRGPRLDALLRELGNLGLPFEAPPGARVIDEDGMRVVYCLLRLVRDQHGDIPDYPAYRALMGLLRGVGPGTAREVAELCLENAANFRDIFHVPVMPGWLTGRTRSAVERVREVTTELRNWQTDDTLEERADALRGMLMQLLGGDPEAQAVMQWAAVAENLPGEIVPPSICWTAC